MITTTYYIFDADDYATDNRGDDFSLDKLYVGDHYSEGDTVESAIKDAVVQLEQHLDSDNLHKEMNADIFALVTVHDNIPKWFKIGEKLIEADGESWEFEQDNVQYTGGAI